MAFDKNKFFDYVAQNLAQEFAKEAPKQSGRLARSFLSTVRVEGTKIKFTLPFYAGAVLEGSAPHVITPKDAKSLKFQSGGTTVFAKKVMHPGNRPNPFMKDVLNRRLKDIIKEGLKFASR